MLPAGNKAKRLDIGQPYHKNNPLSCLVNNLLSKFLVNYYLNNILERTCIFFRQLTSCRNPTINYRIRIFILTLSFSAYGKYSNHSSEGGFSPPFFRHPSLDPAFPSPPFDKYLFLLLSFLFHHLFKDILASLPTLQNMGGGEGVQTMPTQIWLDKSG